MTRPLRLQRRRHLRHAITAVAILEAAGLAVAIAGTPVNWAINDSGNIYKADSISDPHVFHVDGSLFNIIGAFLVSPTPPTIASGGCTTGSAQSVSANNGSAAFQITLGGATCGSTITLTMPAAPTNWVCDAHNITTPATQIMDMTGAASTTAVVLTNYVRTTGVAGNFTGAELIAVKCLPY